MPCSPRAARKQRCPAGPAALTVALRYEAGGGAGLEHAEEELKQRLQGSRLVAAAHLRARHGLARRLVGGRRVVRWGVGRSAGFGCTRTGPWG